MTIDDLFIIQNEKNIEYKNNYSPEIEITSYTYRRNKENWKETVESCSEVLFQELKKKFPFFKIWFWVKYLFLNEPTRVEQYKGILNNKRLGFLSERKITYQGLHKKFDKVGVSAFLEITDTNLFSDVLNYLRDSNDGILFLRSEITNQINFDEQIYSSYKDISSLETLIINEGLVILRPTGSFDDQEFCIETYCKK